jgi:hypothetical protein
MSGHPDMVDCLPGLRRPFIQKPFSLNALPGSDRTGNARLSAV